MLLFIQFVELSEGNVALINWPLSRAAKNIMPSYPVDINVNKQVNMCLIKLCKKFKKKIKIRGGGVIAECTKYTLLRKAKPKYSREKLFQIKNTLSFFFIKNHCYS